MTDRERWTVYPLLFLALGITVKDKLVNLVNVKFVNAERVSCNALVVTDRGGKDRVVITSTPAGGLVNVDKVQCSTLIVTDRGGKDRVVLASTPAGGIVSVRSDGDFRDTRLGYFDNFAGLWFVDAHGNLRPTAVSVQTSPLPSPPERPQSNRNGGRPADQADPAPKQNQAPADETPRGDRRRDEE
jgi:hypothetical protein